MSSVYKFGSCSDGRESTINFNFSSYPSGQFPFPSHMYPHSIQQYFAPLNCKLDPVQHDKEVSNAY